MKKILFLILFLTGITPVFKNNSLNLGCSQAYSQDMNGGELEEVFICSNRIEVSTSQQGDWLVEETCHLENADGVATNPCVSICEETDVKWNPSDPSDPCIDPFTGENLCDSGDPDPNPEGGGGGGSGSGSGGDRIIDCNGVINGTAYMTSCGCIGGDTGKSICPPTCTTTCPTTGYNLINCKCIPCNNLAKANLSELSYDTHNGLQKDPSKLPSNVTVVPPPSSLNASTNTMEQLQFTNPNTGFNSALYRVDHGNGNIEYVYATAGTNDILDAVTDYQQAFDQWTSQYQQSRENAVKLAIWAADNGYTLSFTGHSLGGGLANVNALATGLKATLYNPAGLSQGTINDPDLNLNMGNQGNVTAYVVSGEPVNILNGLLNTPIRAGTIKNIGEPVTNYIAATVLSAVTLTPAEIKLHSISTVEALIDCNN